jgi:hypothetical protein
VFDPVSDQTLLFKAASHIAYAAMPSIMANGSPPQIPSWTTEPVTFGGAEQVGAQARHEFPPHAATAWLARA